MVKNLTLIFTILAGAAFGQKLPNVQEQPLRAPSGIKMDGKATEWTGKFQAKNSATDITYAISNDDDNLYLVFQAATTEVSNKIMMTGLNLQIYKGGKKDVKNVISIAYPVFEMGKRAYFSWLTHVRGEAIPSTEVVEKRMDSLTQLNNNKLSTQAKWIAVHGIAGVDSLISVYNDEGFKAASTFDNKKVFTCEIAMSLKNLGLTATQAQKFAYHIVLNGGPGKANAPVVFGATMADGTPMPAAQFEAGQARLAAAYGTTDFWGEYTLAAKP